MPNNRSRGNGDFSRFDGMTDEELEQLLRLDARKKEGAESDLDEILCVMEVLADRNKNRLSDGKSVEEAFASFQRNYMPQEDSPEGEALSKPEGKPRRWLPRLSAVAAAIAVAVVCSATAGAFGFDIWQTIAQWTQETFHFGNGSDVDVVAQAQTDTSLRERLNDYNITEALAPAWFPEGYELADIIIDETPMKLGILALYQNGDQTIIVQIENYLDGDPQQVERSDSLVEVYESEGIPYYIFSNNQVLQAVWVNESYECFISGALSIDDIKTMINSITKE